MDRRRYLEVACGASISIGGGCLGAGNGTDPSTTNSTTGGTSRSSETEQTTARTSTTERTTSRATETDSIRSLPSVSFTFEYETVDEDGQVSITHVGGDSLSGRRTGVVIGGTRVFDGGTVTSSYYEVTNEWTETVATDDTLTVRGSQKSAIDEYQTVEIEWTPEGSENAELIGRSTVDF